MTKNYEKDFDLNKTLEDFVTNNIPAKIPEVVPVKIEFNSRIFDTMKLPPLIKIQFMNKYILNYMIQDKSVLSKLKLAVTTNAQLNILPKKYAIQLSGHMRHLSLDKWQTFVSNNPTVDVFIHTWTGSGDRKKGSWINEPENREINVNRIMDAFKPKKILIENNNEYLEHFSIYNMDKTLKIFYEHRYIPFEETGDMSRYIVSQLYSVYTVNKLRNDYEKLKNIKYDFVFRVRADNFVDIKIDELSTITNNDNILYMNSDSHNHPMHGRGCAACCYEYPNKFHTEHANMVCDIFYFGSPKIIDKVSSMYLHIIDILKGMEKYNDEIVKAGSFNHLLIPKKYPGYAVTQALAEEFIFKCVYPERLIVEFMKDEFLLTDPLRHYVAFK